MPAVGFVDSDRPTATAPPTANGEGESDAKSHAAGAGGAHDSDSGVRKSSTGGADILVVHPPSARKPPGTAPAAAYDANSPPVSAAAASPPPAAATNQVEMTRFGTRASVGGANKTGAGNGNGAAAATDDSIPALCDYCGEDRVVFECTECVKPAPPPAAGTAAAPSPAANGSFLCELCDTVLHKAKAKRSHVRYAIISDSGAGDDIVGHDATGRSIGFGISGATTDSPLVRPRTAGAAAGRSSGAPTTGPVPVGGAAGALRPGVGRGRPQSAHTHAERNAALAAASGATTASNGSVLSSGAQTPVLRANGSGAGSKPVPFIPPLNTTGKYRFAWPPTGSVPVCEFSVRLEYMSARDSDMRYPSGLGEYLQFTMTWGPLNVPNKPAATASAAGAEAASTPAPSASSSSSYIEVVLHDYKVVNATTGITKPLLYPASNANSRPASAAASGRARTPDPSAAANGGARRRSFVVDSDGHFVCLLSTFDPSLPYATNLLTGRTPAGTAPGGSLSGRGPSHGNGPSGGGSNARPPWTTPPARPTAAPAAAGSPFPPTPGADGAAGDAGSDQKQADAAAPASAGLSARDERALHAETAECRSYWHAMVSAFLDISTAETDNSFFRGKRLNGGKMCVKLAIHPVAHAQAVRRFTKEKVLELARKISPNKRLPTEVHSASMDYVFATFTEPDTLRPHIVDCSKTSESTFTIGGTAASTAAGGSATAKQSVFYLMQAKRWVVLWPDLPDLGSKNYMKVNYYDYIRICQTLEQNARHKLNLHDIATDEDAKFQSFIAGDDIKAFARQLFDVRVSALRPATAVVLDTATPTPPPTAAAAAGASTAPAAATAVALDLVRDMLLLYAMTCDVFVYFNTTTKAIFKKKPPELTKPLFVEVKRSVAAMYGLPPSRPPSAAPDTKTAPAAAVGVLPPIGKRWMKSTEFAAFAHSMVTTKFQMAEDESFATAAAGPSVVGAASGITSF